MSGKEAKIDVPGIGCAAGIRDGNMLLWRSEKSALDPQQLEQQQQLERQKKQLTRLDELLRRAGIFDEEVRGTGAR